MAFKRDKSTFGSGLRASGGHLDSRRRRVMAGPDAPAKKRPESGRGTPAKQQNEKD